jgi:DNA primase
VVALAQSGFANAVATLGTACTADHVQKLFRFTDAVVFSVDGDAAGRRAARKALDGALPYASDVRNVKFLFLPAEHDPDSYIREHGSEAFARLVSDATPLSRFLVDVARDGCDIDSAEGRALLASQARPLWLALPDGVLKTQLLNELADLVGIGTRELQRLWLGDSSAKTQRTASPGQSGGKPRETSAPRRSSSPVSMRRKAPTRQDRALQILFTDMAQWSALALPQQHMLMDLPAPHGRLFSWLDSQSQEHGVQPLAALREGLRGHEDEDMLMQLLASAPVDMDNDVSELQSIMLELEKAHVSSQIDDLTRRMASDPAAYAQIKVLNSRLASLKKSPLVQ